MRILVTGAAGFIGSHLCERLLAEAGEVIGVDSFDPFYDRRLKERNLAGCQEHQRFRFMELDLRDASALGEAWDRHCQSLDAVVHLAARPGVRPSIEDPVACSQANILATNNLLERVVRAQPPPRFIFGSSSSVYGNNAKVPFCETDPVERPISPYAATKRAGELMCYTYHHLYRLPVTALRLFTVYGPRQRPDLAIQKFITRLVEGRSIEVFGDGGSSRDYTYIDDIVAGVLAAIERCRGYEIVNLGSERPITLEEMIETIEQAVGKRAIKERRPVQPGDVNRTFADLTKARTLLGYEPATDFSSGVRRQVKWFLSTGG